MRFDVLTLFPEMFSGYLTQSLLKLAIERGLVRIELHNIRDWSRDKHQCVDDRPFGGGPGMVIKPEPTVEAVEEVQTQGDSPGAFGSALPARPAAQPAVVEELATHQRLLLLCGRYEGFDQRVSDILQPEEISVGDFVLNGGEVAAMTVIDTVDPPRAGSAGRRRQQPGRFVFDRQPTAGVQPIHAAPRVSRPGGAGSVAERRPPADRRLARDKTAIERTRQRRPDLLR